MGEGRRLTSRRRSDPGSRRPRRNRVQLNDEGFRLSAAVDPATNHLPHVKLYPTRTVAITPAFLSELREKHRDDDPVFLVDSAQWLRAAPGRHALRFRYERHATRNSAERVFRKVKR